VLSHLDSKQRLAYVAIAALLLFGLSYVGAAQLHRPAPIVFEGTKGGGSAVSPSNSNTVDPPPAEVVVHVVGAVKNPGVVHLPNGARAVDAIDKAGGSLTNADLEQLNLAAKVQDGTQLYVPRKGQAPSPPPRRSSVTGQISPLQVDVPDRIEVAPPYRAVRAVPDAPVGSTSPLGRSGSRAKKEAPTGTVSLNSATLEELETLPGVGPATAQKILDFRTSNGGFKTVDDLLSVKGIGPKKLEKIRPYVQP
jgi:competence protein ComEA